MKLEDTSPLMDGQRLADLLTGQTKQPKGIITPEAPSEITEKGLKVRSNRWTDHEINE